MAWIPQWDMAPQNLQRAFELEKKALALDDALARAHFILGWIYMFQAKYEPAVAAAERAIALAPNNERSYVALANVFNFSGQRTTEAIALLEKAMRLNPHSSFELPFNLGWAYNLVGRYEEAIAAQKQALLRNPNWPFSHAELLILKLICFWRPSTVNSVETRTPKPKQQKCCGSIPSGRWRCGGREYPTKIPRC